MGSFMRKRGLFFSVSAGIMGATLITCVTLTAVGFLNFSHSHTEEVVSSMKKSGESAGKLVDMEIATYIKQVEDIAQRDDVRSMDFSVQQPILAEACSRRLVRQIKAAMEEQNQGSRQITEALHNMNDSTSEVKNASQEMSAGSQEILKEVHALQDATLGMKRKMDEMAIGARKINETGAALSEISEEMAASISGIGAQVDQFEV